MVMKIKKKTCSHKGKCSCNGSSRKMKGGSKEPTHNQLMKIFNDLIQKENVIDRFKQSNIEALDNVEEMGEKESKKEYREALLLLNYLEDEVPKIVKTSQADSVLVRNEMMRAMKLVMNIYNKPLDVEIKSRLQRKLSLLSGYFEKERERIIVANQPNVSTFRNRAIDLLQTLETLIDLAIENPNDIDLTNLEREVLPEGDDDDEDDVVGQGKMMKYKPKNKNRQKVMTIASKLQKKGYNKSQALKLAYKVMKEK